MSRRVALVWTFGCAFIVLLFAVDLVQLATGAATADALWRRDFTNVWTGGQLIGARDWATLYDRSAFTAYQVQVFGAFGPRSFSYPPTAFPLVQLFAQPPYRIAAGPLAADEGPRSRWRRGDGGPRAPVPTGSCC